MLTGEPGVPRMDGLWSHTVAVSLTIAVILLSTIPSQAQVTPPKGQGQATQNLKQGNPSNPPGEVNPEVSPGVQMTPEAATETRPTGPLQSLGSSLIDVGIIPHAIFLDFGGTNPGSGLVPDNSGNIGLIVTSADFDLQKIIGIPGGMIHFGESAFLFNNNAGFQPNNYRAEAGSFLGGFQLPMYSTSSYLEVLSYEQALLKGRLHIEVGRINATRAFDIPNCQIVTTCQNPISLYTAQEPPPTYSNWGGRVAYRVASNLGLQIGVYEDNLALTSTNGYSFNTDTATGTLFITQLAQQTSFRNAIYPGNYSITSFYRTTAQVSPADPRKRVDGTEGVVFKGQQVIWRRMEPGSPGAPPQNLTLYGTAEGTPDRTQPFTAFFTLGLNWWGYLSSRPSDHVGVEGTYARAGPDQDIFQTERRGLSSRLNPNEFRFQLDDHFQLFRGTAVEPAIQYIVHPDSVLNRFGRAVPRDGFFFGAALIVPLGEMLGLAPPSSH